MKCFKLRIIGLVCLASFVSLFLYILLSAPCVFSWDLDTSLVYTSPTYFDYNLPITGNRESSISSLPGFTFLEENTSFVEINLGSSLFEEANYIGLNNIDREIDNNYIYSVKFENANSFLYTPTYDGSKQVVHPDIVYFPNGWHGYKYWMAMTPYPMSNKSHENPSILVSQDGYSWEVPEGLSNPIVSHPKGGWNADTDLIYNPDTDELWMYYVRFKNHLCTLYRVRSHDGITWQDEEYVFSEPLFQILSPAIVYKDGVYHLWYVDANSKGIDARYTDVKYRTSVDGLNWSEPQIVNMNHDGYYVWHLDVAYIPQLDEFWMFFPGFSNKIKTTRTVLFFARAKNPTEWTTQPEPVLERGSRGSWDSTRIYRSTFLYDEEEGKVRLWYSAARKHNSFVLTIYSWHIGYTECNYPIISTLSAP